MFEYGFDFYFRFCFGFENVDGLLDFHARGLDVILLQLCYDYLMLIDISHAQTFVFFFV